MSRMRIGAALTLAGALFGSAIGAWAGSKTYRPATYREIDDLSRPNKWESTVSYKPGPVDYTFKYGETGWRVTASMYGLTDRLAIAEKVNYVGRHEANRKHHDNRLLKDTKAVKDGKVVNEGDGIIFDEIQAGDTVTYPDVPNAVSEKTKGKAIGYEQMRVVDNPGSPSKAKPYGLLGSLLGSLFGLGYASRKLRRKEENPKALEPLWRPPVPDVWQGYQRTIEQNEIDIFAGLDEFLDKIGCPRRSEDVEAFDFSGVDEIIGKREKSDLDRAFDYAMGEIANKRELQTVRSTDNIAVLPIFTHGEVVKEYVFERKSVRAIAEKYGRKTEEVRQMLAESAPDMMDYVRSSPFASYRWSKKLAGMTEFGGRTALDIANSIILEGGKKPASQLAKEIRYATGFEMSTSTVYRMRRKLAESTEQRTVA